LSIREAGGYVAAQTVGGLGGAVLANLMFSLAPVTFSHTERAAANLWLGEVVATAGLVLVIFALVRTGRALLAAPAVGAYIGAAYWFTSSTSFANPAVTIGRAFTDTFAGIAPASVVAFVTAQLVGGLAGVGLLAVLYPPAGPAAGQVAVHPRGQERR
jgi:glycerol uptake facilitator-like aquaporin